MLKGANGDELKKVKHVIQYGIFAAYHLALETSFLADEGASLPELPLKSPITVALPDKPSSIGRSISTFSGFSIPASSNLQVTNNVPRSSKSDPMSMEQGKQATHEQQHMATLSSSPQYSSTCDRDEEKNMGFVHHCAAESAGYNGQRIEENSGWAEGEGRFKPNDICEDTRQTMERQLGSSVMEISHQENNQRDDHDLSREEFSTSDHQSILVSLSSRCIWKGTVCERAHLFRIKYYGSFDKPLGRFLRDNLFDDVSLFNFEFFSMYYLVKGDSDL